MHMRISVHGCGQMHVPSMPLNSAQAAPILVSINFGVNNWCQHLVSIFGVNFWSICLTSLLTVGRTHAVLIIQGFTQVSPLVPTNNDE